MVDVKEISYVPMEDLLRQVESRYKLVILASRRAVELNGGGEKLVEVNPAVKLSTVALEEIREGKITYKQSKKGD